MVQSLHHLGFWKMPIKTLFSDDSDALVPYCFQITREWIETHICAYVTSSNFIDFVVYHSISNPLV